MTDILSHEEIESLLSVLDDDSGYVDSLDNTIERSTVALYDFKRPNRLSKEILRSIRNIHDKISRSITSSLSVILKTPVEIMLHSIDQMTYGEFLMGLENPIHFNTGRMCPLDGNFVLTIDTNVVFSSLDIIVGGDGIVPKQYREFSDIEYALFRPVLRRVEDALEIGWKEILETEFIIDSSESSPNIVQILGHNDFVCVSVMEVIINGIGGMLTVCYPIDMIEKVLNDFNNMSECTNHSIFDDDIIMDIPIDVEAIMGEYTLSVREILNMKPQDVIMIDRTVTLKVQSKIVGAGEIADPSFNKRIKIISLDEK